MNTPETNQDDELVKHMVNRFLGWRLPDDFQPDAGISFKPLFNEHTPSPNTHQPIGTNLFTATQAEQMVRWMLEGADRSTNERKARIKESRLAIHHWKNDTFMVGYLKRPEQLEQLQAKTDHKEVER